MSRPLPLFAVAPFVASSVGLSVALCARPAAALPVSSGCGGAATAIAEIRRAGGPSPLAGQTTSIEAVVTAAFGGADGLGGFFVQQADAQRRRRPGIPEGLFVYAPNARAAPGDLVHLTGKVDEQYGRTQFTLTGGMAVCARGQT
ncbi:endonuclease, partial [Burkholderia cenocepacia]|nr:endonuclease [Burkholderia cenocepacia]